MRDLYKNDFCDVVRDGSSLALQVSYLKILLQKSLSGFYFLMRDVYKDDFRDVARVFDVLFVKNLFDR